MGATSSISISSEQAEKLSEESIRDFKLFEEALCSKNLSSEEIQSLLVTKFQELMEFEKRSTSMRKSRLELHTASSKGRSQKHGRRASHTGSLSSKGRNESPAKNRSMVRKYSWGVDIEATKRIEDRQKIHDTYSRGGSRRHSTSSKKQITSDPLLASSSMDSIDTVQEEYKLTNECTCSSMSTDNEDNSMRGFDLHSMSSDTEFNLVTDDDLSGDEVDEPKTAIVTNSPLKKVLSSIPEHYECKLCKKKFPSKALLETHLTHSQLHRQALLELRKKYISIYKNVERIDEVVRKATEQFTCLLKQCRKHAPDTSSLPMQRWHKAVHRVMSLGRVERVSKVLHELEEQNKAPSLHYHPPSLLCEDSKFFWRLKTWISLQYYYHDLFNVIEIVPLVLPGGLGGMGEGESSKGNVEGVARSGSISTLRSSIPSLPCPRRLYVDSHIVLSAAQKEHSPGDHEENPHTGNIKSLRNIDLMKTHLSSRVKIDYKSVVEDGKSIENSIYFDDTHYPLSDSPVLSGTPPGVCPVIVMDGKVERWEIMEKMEELSMLQKELSQAVIKAEEIAEKIRIYTPKNRLDNGFFEV